MIKYLDELEKILNKYNLSKKDICLINSSAISDIRENRDLDFAIRPSVRNRFLIKNYINFKISKNGTIYFSENIQAVKNRYSLIGISDYMLFDSKNHDEINGYYVVKKEIEIAKKVLIQRNKDIEDLNSISNSNLFNNLDWKRIYEIAYFSKPCLSMRLIKKRISNIRRKIVHIVKKNISDKETYENRKTSEFIAILWGTMFDKFGEIKEFIEGKYPILEYKIVDMGSNLYDFIEQLYKIDNIDKWKIRIKQAYLLEYNGSIGFIKFVIKDGTYKINKRTKDEMCVEEVSLKKEIREKYSKLLNKYIYDVIIHICDNSKNNIKIEELVKMEEKK